VDECKPLHAGAVYWVRGLVERIKEPMEKLRGLNKLVMETEESKVGRCSLKPVDPLRVESALDS